MAVIWNVKLFDRVLVKVTSESAAYQLCGILNSGGTVRFCIAVHRYIDHTLRIFHHATLQFVQGFAGFHQGGQHL